MKRKRRWLLWVCLTAIAAAAAVQWSRVRTAQAAESLPTAPVRQGEFSVVIRCRGELRARRSVQVTAPVNVPELRIVWVAPSGTAVRQGDPVVRFDPSSARQQLQQKEAALRQAQAAMEQAIAQARITAEQDKLELAAARYVVEKAKLEVSKQEIVSRLQGEESRVELSLAEKKLSVQEANVKLNEVSGEAKVASLTRARDAARVEMELNQYRLSQMELRAPISGLINFLPKYSQGWMNAKPYKVGDQVASGVVLAEVPDLDTLEMEGKIEEIDRGRMTVDQVARVRMDSLPETTFPARLVQLSPLTVMTWEWPPSRTFRGYARVDKPDKRLRPGMAGQVDVVINRLPQALSVPAQALFTLQGKPVVYVAGTAEYRPAFVEVLARNPDEVAVKGVDAGAKVALVEPEQAKSNAKVGQS